MSQQDGISLRRFAEQVGVSENCLRKWCMAGKVIGASKHPLTKKWTIYPPAKLATGGQWRFPALKVGAA
jgi:hypothetical protein